MQKSDSPQVDKRTFDSLLDEFMSLVPYYMKNWNPKQDDFGIALAKLFMEILEDVIERLNKVPDRNFIAFLNMLGFQLLPPKPSSAPVTLNPSDGFEGEVLIPKGTKLAGMSNSGQIPFETKSNFYSTTAKILQALYWNRRYDEIYNFTQDYKSHSQFSIFTHLPARNIQKHTLYLGHPDLFNVRAGSTVILHLFCEPSKLPSFESLIDDSILTQWTIITLDPETSQETSYDLDVSKSTYDTTNQYLEVFLQVPEDIGEIKEVEVNGVKSRWIKFSLIDPYNIDFDDVIKREITRFTKLNFTQIKKSELNRLVKKTLRKKDPIDKKWLDRSYFNLMQRCKGESFVRYDAIEKINLIKQLKQNLTAGGTLSLEGVTMHEKSEDLLSLECMEIPNITMACANIIHSPIVPLKDCCQDMEDTCCPQSVLDDPCMDVSEPHIVLKGMTVLVPAENSTFIPPNSAMEIGVPSTHSRDFEGTELSLMPGTEVNLTDYRSITPESETTLNLINPTSVLLHNDYAASPPPNGTILFPNDTAVKIPQNSSVGIKAGTLFTQNYPIQIAQNTQIRMKYGTIFTSPQNNPVELSKDGEIIIKTNANLKLQKNTALTIPEQFPLIINGATFNIPQKTDVKIVKPIAILLKSASLTSAIESIIPAGTRISIPVDAQINIDNKKIKIPVGTTITLLTSQKIIVSPSELAKLNNVEALTLESAEVRLNNITPVRLTGRSSLVLPLSSRMILDAQIPFLIPQNEHVNLKTMQLNLSTGTSLILKRQALSNLKNNLIVSASKATLDHGTVSLRSNIETSTSGAILRLPDDAKITISKETPVDIKLGTIITQNNSIKIQQGTHIDILPETEFLLPMNTSVYVPNIVLILPENTPALAPPNTKMLVDENDCIAKQDTNILLPKGVGFRTDSPLATVENTTVRTFERFEAELLQDITVNPEGIQLKLDNDTTTVLPKDFHIKPQNTSFNLSDTDKIIVPQGTPIDIGSETEFTLPQGTRMTIDRGTPIQINSGTELMLGQNTGITLPSESEILMTQDKQIVLANNAEIVLLADTIVSSNTVPSINMGREQTISLQANKRILVPQSAIITFQSNGAVIIDKTINVVVTKNPIIIEDSSGVEELLDPRFHDSILSRLSDSRFVLPRSIRDIESEIRTGRILSDTPITNRLTKEYAITSNYTVKLSGVKLKLENTNGKLSTGGLVNIQESTPTEPMNVSATTRTSMPIQFLQDTKFHLAKEYPASLSEKTKIKFTDTELILANDTDLKPINDIPVNPEGIQLKLDNDTTTVLPKDFHIKPQNTSFNLSDTDKIIVPQGTPIDIGSETEFTLPQGTRMTIDRGTPIQIKDDARISSKNISVITSENPSAKIPQNTGITLMQDTDVEIISPAKDEESNVK